MGISKVIYFFYAIFINLLSQSSKKIDESDYNSFLQEYRNLNDIYQYTESGKIYVTLKLLISFLLYRRNCSTSFRFRRNKSKMAIL